MKDTMLKIRVSSQQMETLRSAARLENLTVSAFVLGILFPNEGKPVAADRIEAVVEAAATPAPKGVAHRSLSFKQSPKCESRRCAILRAPTCDACRQINAKGFS